MISYIPNYSVMLTSFKLLDEDTEEDVGLVLEESAVLVNAFNVHRLLVVGEKQNIHMERTLKLGLFGDLHFTPRLN